MQVPAVPRMRHITGIRLLNGSVYNPAFEAGASVTSSFASVGDYKVKVAAVSPYSSVPVEKVVDITVTADGENPLQTCLLILTVLSVKAAWM
jgi:hypothetical protein